MDGWMDEWIYNMHVYMYACIYMYVSVLAISCIRIHTRVYIHTVEYCIANINTYIYTYTHTHTHTHTPGVDTADVFVAGTPNHFSHSINVINFP